MGVAVVGGGIVGLLAAWNLEKEGADVTLFEEGALGAGSIHAAGIIEPMNAFRTNTFAFLRTVWRFWRRGTCTFRSVDARWLFDSLRHLERDPPAAAADCLREMAQTSVADYQAFADGRNDFAYTPLGLVEPYDDPAHFSEERETALARQSLFPVEVRERKGFAGELYFPDASWLHTEQFVARLAGELKRTRVVRQRVHRVEIDGTVSADSARSRFDAVVVCTGVSCRKLGVPLTGVRGYGWHARSRSPVDRATIFVDRGIAVVPFATEVKVTGGWDFDLSNRPYHSRQVLASAQQVHALDEVLDFREGSRPCTPDGLPTVGKQGQVVVATGGFRLGWSFGPALGRHAALLALGRTRNDPFLARFATSLHSATL